MCFTLLYSWFFYDLLRRVCLDPAFVEWFCQLRWADCSSFQSLQSLEREQLEVCVLGASSYLWNGWWESQCHYPQIHTIPKSPSGRCLIGFPVSQIKTPVADPVKAVLADPTPFGPQVERGQIHHRWGRNSLTHQWWMEDLMGNFHDFSWNIAIYMIASGNLMCLVVWKIH